MSEWKKCNLCEDLSESNLYGWYVIKSSPPKAVCAPCIGKLEILKEPTEKRKNKKVALVNHRSKYD